MLVGVIFVCGFVAACGSARSVTDTLSAQTDNTYPYIEDGTTVMQTLQAVACGRDETVSPPWVVGQGEAAARKRLAKAHFKVQLFPRSSQAVRSGIVIRQLPPRHAAVCPGFPIMLVVSSRKAVNPTP